MGENRTEQHLGNVHEANKIAFILCQTPGAFPTLLAGIRFSLVFWRNNWKLKVVELVLDGA